MEQKGKSAMFRQIIIGTAALFGLASTAQVAPNFIAFN
jgi:hypothetical protein